MKTDEDFTKMKKTAGRFLLVFTILYFLAASACVEDAFSQSQKSFLWRVRSKTTTVYILGSLHFFKKEFYPLNKKIDEAFDQSQMLAVEADVRKAAAMDIQKLKEKAFYGGEDRLEKHVSRETYESVIMETGRLGIPLDVVNRQKPWFLSFTLGALELLKLGFDPRQGIDIYFISKASSKKEILELEGLDYQFDLLSRFNEKEQELFLVYTLKDLNIIGQEIEKYVSAWTSGDAQGMESLIMKGMTEEIRQSGIPEKLFFDRNRNMTSKIEGFLKTKQTYFVIVGSGHLVGSKGIIELLIGKGYPVEQL